MSTIQEPTPQVSTPSQGSSLATVGITNSMAERVWLPAGTELTYTADQPNLLIAIGVLGQADQVQDYLRQTLPGLGWTITADEPGGLIFEQSDWHGGYAVGADSWALTVRDD